MNGDGDEGETFHIGFFYIVFDVWTMIFIYSRISIKHEIQRK